MSSGARDRHPSLKRRPRVKRFLALEMSFVEKSVSMIVRVLSDVASLWSLSGSTSPGLEIGNGLDTRSLQVISPFSSRSLLADLAAGAQWGHPMARGAI
jgi:hypothetical protein